MLLSDLIKQLQATKTILGEFKLCDVLADKIIEMIAEEKMLRDELTESDILGRSVNLISNEKHEPLNLRWLVLFWWFIVAGLMPHDFPKSHVSTLRLR